MMVPSNRSLTPKKRISINFDEKNGAPDRIRTCDLQIRSLLLYPTELLARGLYFYINLIPNFTWTPLTFASPLIFIPDSSNTDVFNSSASVSLTI